MEPRHGRSAFTISFSNPNGFVNQRTAIPAVSYPAAGSSQLDVLAPRGCKRKWTELALGLGDSSSSDSSKQSMGTGCTVSSAKGSDDASCMDYDISFKLSLCNEGTSKLHKQACDSKRTMERPRLNLKLSLAPSQSDVTDADLIRSSAPQDMFVHPYLMSSVPTVDEGSTSARHSSGGMVTSFLNRAGISLSQAFPFNSNQVQGPAPSAPTVLLLPKSSAASSSGFVRSQQRNSSTKICSQPGCAKGARGSSGRCIAHGGGRRCQKEGCNKGAEGMTIFYKAHGGGKRCEHLGFMKGAKGQHEANRACVSSMVVVRGAKSQTAQRAPKGGQACALLMVAGTAVSMLGAGRELRAAPISAKPMVAARDAHTLTVRVQREARHSAKHMEAASVVQPTAARRACLVGPSSASRMEVGRGARLKDAGRAQEAGRTVVLAMVGASDATSLAVERARREAPTSASHTVEAGAAHWDIWVQTSDQAVLLATVWQEAKRGYAIDTTRWWMTTVSTVCHFCPFFGSCDLKVRGKPHVVFFAGLQAPAPTQLAQWFEVVATGKALRSYLLMASITTHKSNGDKAGESPKILCEMLQYLGHQERPLYQGFKEVVNDREEWRVEVLIHTTKKPNKPLIIEAACRRATFSAGIRDAACQAMYRLRDMYADDLSTTPYRYFPRRRICNTDKEILHYYKKHHHHQHDRLLNQQIRLTEALVAVCDNAFDELREARCKIRELEEELRKQAPRHKHKAIIASSLPPHRRVIVGDKKPYQSPGHKASIGTGTGTSSTQTHQCRRRQH
ncbi:unnamed protein product [Miscanthus lutarioriparius]|uniref:WRKY19-like zinc finger domain-containing protein n=1 Tax=Miscanthus lutarioriparius TaxID=422564 RepID=A0A811ST48_9POAL|nr:unnamed protein product [Miscanthus lutarioriparius]